MTDALERWEAKLSELRIRYESASQAGSGAASALKKQIEIYEDCIRQLRERGAKP